MLFLFPSIILLSRLLELSISELNIFTQFAILQSEDALSNNVYFWVYKCPKKGKHRVYDKGYFNELNHCHLVQILYKYTFLWLSV